MWQLVGCDLTNKAIASYIPYYIYLELISLSSIRCVNILRTNIIYL